MLRSIDLVAEVAGDRQDRLAVDAVEDPGRLRRGQDHAVAHHVDVLARALAHEAVGVEQDRLLVAGLVGLDLGQDAVQVLARGLRVRDERVVRDPPPARHLRPHAGLLALLAQVGAPRPHGDRHVDGGIEREQSHLAVAPERDRADVALAQLVGGDQLVGGRPQLVHRVGDRHVVELGRLEQAVEVVEVAEDAGAARRLVRADALEHTGAVVQAVREYVNLGVLPGDELPVVPDEVRLLHDDSLQVL